MSGLRSSYFLCLCPPASLPGACLATHLPACLPSLPLFLQPYARPAISLPTVGIFGTFAALSGRPSLPPSVEGRHPFIWFAAAAAAAAATTHRSLSARKLE